ncbi:30S ribosomal protein S9 [Candidatus Roizmanbacteria bacterium RIFCSPHIGHO2_02_FULL_37_15]|uniref:30S ribosomal protein S9 n=1 Tax=Candidatus Roizmanbacteria bacterium RIFCSPLOWO2_01_FULL_37_16 TaxID=1802058 RepID=A0A1F7IQV9_9BACT|nr:MAG: 30S ribosomal protein S9 [Candidatus Roizmanbacteria bacterium RIFCSPHIGHO2_01_FULL_37_16b]OGK20751.1 MAG: 30S ribosomal protein S9 [Candidatus Roizmanbacteria bacterium RIFCSPHIGHO2_02_FULL_37_15]OGK33037.1 MAG: 30S ribosomal protein S9 [Candidatus Roizmanbacteria bacterium RIFCSPHIGHO2_12_FULL_36_11]OGK45744.1 MAG: 30S ribosomal protein S9 [Candidatus Roizmanbacteria bacterium RIFCSPLOWO2_01_FULL_37_16]OGK56077.1 MAG: 30S ribosomal protein S9 [Candidatus Roizmanbacteria bacterium RIFC
MAKKKESKYYEAIGRRKEAVARIRLHLTDKDKSTDVGGMKVKAGEIFVNKKPITQVFPNQQAMNRYLLPLKLTNNENRFAVTIIVKGGGKSGQLDAIIHGLARAIEKVDKQTYRLVLKKRLLLRRDARVKERRKVGTGGKARRKKQSPKR